MTLTAGTVHTTPRGHTRILGASGRWYRFVVRSQGQQFANYGELLSLDGAREVVWTGRDRPYGLDGPCLDDAREAAARL
jgi:hypothetical protein